MFEHNLATPNILIMQLTHVKSKQHIDEAEILSSTRFERNEVSNKTISIISKCNFVYKN